MKSFEDLERRWRALPAAPRGRGWLHLICIRREGGQHECPPRVFVSKERGLEGDRWVSSGRHRNFQATLMSVRTAQLLAADNQSIEAAGDNFLVDLDLEEAILPVGARIRIGAATLTVSPALHAGCKKFGERFGAEALRWVNHPEHRGRRLRGVNCIVIVGGVVAVGDPLVIL
jgi:MOSC domain-containing protein YiiM